MEAEEEEVSVNLPNPGSSRRVLPHRGAMRAMDLNIDQMAAQDQAERLEEASSASGNGDNDIIMTADSDDESLGAKSDASEVTCGSYFQFNEDAPSNRVAQKQWDEYVVTANKDFIGLNWAEAAGIKLMNTLRKKKCSLDTYAAVMEWHLRETGSLEPDDKLGDAAEYYSRESLIHKLALRYNVHPRKCIEAQMEAKKAGKRKTAPPKLYMERPLLLPGSKTKVDIIYFDFQELVVQLLHDPRFTDNDWLHLDNNPLAPPPPSSRVLGDVNTGTAYRKTYQKLIKDPSKEMLVPIIFYIDGATTGQFVDLKVEQLKFTLGTLNRNARDQEYAWKTLGYVPNARKEIAGGKKMFVKSKHDASALWSMDKVQTEHDDAQEELVKVTSKSKAMDWNAIIAAFLESHQVAERDGMVVDLQYGRKLYKNITLKFFTLLIKADAEEADKLCGKFLSRTANVKHLCRYCMCPNHDTDNCVASYACKTEPQIANLTRRNKEEELRAISQHCFQPAFHGIRFGLHNKRGVHGATPIEELHQVLLGMFKHVLEAFFEQVGPTSIAAQEINALCTMIGKLIAHQSDRNLPKTTFGQGIHKGKLMGKEMAGVILLLATVVQTTAGKAILTRGVGSRFKNDSTYKDWVMLLESLLTWESFLNEKEMDIRVVRLLDWKHRYLMYMCKKILDRQKGRGFKLVKFHCMHHMADDILMFGVPSNVKTDANESHHKPTKAAAKCTQRDSRVFDGQTATRVQEGYVLDLAQLELEGKPYWKYLLPKFQSQSSCYDPEELELYVDCVQMDFEPPPRSPTETKGTRIRVFLDTETMEPAFDFPSSRIHSRSNVRWDRDIVEYLVELQDVVFDGLLAELPIYAEHIREGQMFRGCPNHRGMGMWNDWVLVDWGSDKAQPCQIWCFLDLRSLPRNATVTVDDIKVQRGVYAVVESADFEEEDAEEEDPWKSILFQGCRKECKFLNNNLKCVGERQFYLADVEAFVDPVCVIPDVGNSDIMRYLMLKPRTDWAQLFIDWVRADPDEDEMDEECAQGTGSSNSDDASDEVSDDDSEA